MRTPVCPVKPVNLGACVMASRTPDVQISYRAIRPMQTRNDPCPRSIGTCYRPIGTRYRPIRPCHPVGPCYRPMPQACRRPCLQAYGPMPTGLWAHAYRPIPTGLQPIAAIREHFGPKRGACMCTSIKEFSKVPRHARVRSAAWFNTTLGMELPAVVS